MVGRARNMIVTEGGKNIYPEDVESAFVGISAVEELCVFAADFVWPRSSLVGEALIAVVRTGESSTSVLAEIAGRNRAMAAHKRLSGVLMWSEEFPRTASLKVKRGQLAEILRGAAKRADVLPLSEEAA